MQLWMSTLTRFACCCHELLHSVLHEKKIWNSRFYESTVKSSLGWDQTFLLKLRPDRTRSMTPIRTNLSVCLVSSRTAAHDCESENS